jgi:hypothetical protein
MERELLRQNAEEVVNERARVEQEYKRLLQEQMNSKPKLSREEQLGIVGYDGRGDRCGGDR